MPVVTIGSNRGLRGAGVPEVKNDRIGSDSGCLAGDPKAFWYFAPLGTPLTAPSALTMVVVSLNLSARWRDQWTRKQASVASPPVLDHEEQERTPQVGIPDDP